MTAILAYLRDFPFFARAQASGQWRYRRTDELAGKRVLVIGAGAIGEAIAARLAPFGVELVRVARRPRPVCTEWRSCRDCCRRPTSWCSSCR